MKTQINKKRKNSTSKTTVNNDVNVITLGCSENLVDSEKLMGQLLASGINVTHESELLTANTVIINTCGFIDKAKQESIDTILTYADLKSSGKIKKLYVSGCLSERYADELKEEMPEVDAFFGTNNYDDLLDTLNVDYKNNLVGERLLTTDSHFAYLKISEGCDRPCSFCAIPLMRGGHKSRSIEDLVTEAEILAQRGVKELILIAQDLTYYGLDIYQKRNLSLLLEQLSVVKGIEWIRLHYAFPSGFPLDILPVIRESPNICNYLDIPIQHAADPILKAMRRGITKQKSLELMQKIREEVPNIALRTTLLVGYPDETDKDFDELCDFIQQVKFERLGVFTYSHEENTHAYLKQDNIPEEIKNERMEILMEIQQKISFENNENYIGKKLKAIIDRKEGGFYIGRSEFDSPEVDNEIIISSEHNLEFGNFYDIEITDALEFDLFGQYTI